MSTVENFPTEDSEVLKNVSILAPLKKVKNRSLWVAISIFASILGLIYLLMMFTSRCNIIYWFLNPIYKDDPIAYPVARNNLTLNFILVLFISHLADQLACGNICAKSV